MNLENMAGYTSLSSLDPILRFLGYAAKSHNCAIFKFLGLGYVHLSWCDAEEVFIKKSEADSS